VYTLYWLHSVVLLFYVRVSYHCLFSDILWAKMNRFNDDCDEQPVRDGSVNKSEQFGMYYFCYSVYFEMKSSSFCD